MGSRALHIKEKRILMYPILLCLLAVILFSCSGSDALDNGILLYWQETKCNDPWGTKESDDENTVRETLTGYLFDNGIDEFRIWEFAYMLTDGMVTCDSCGCPSETVITVEVDETYVEKMERLGFKYGLAD